MKIKTSLLIIYLTACGLVPMFVSNTVSAETSNTATEDSEPLVPEEFLSKPILNEIELGIGYVTDDAYKFGRYNGLQTKGAFVIGDIKIREFNEDGYFWSVRGTNLGLKSRYLRVEGGLQGSYKLFLEYDELHNYKNDTVQTPFLGVGSKNLTLPTGFDINSNINSNLKNFKLHTKRERIKVGAMFVPKQNWQFDIDFSHENKKGVDASGAAIANGSSQVIGNTTTSILPEPIDQDTDIVNAKVSYSGENGQVNLKYEMSLFNNNHDSLSWQNPFPAPPLATAPAPASGGMSLAPDNEFHQLSLAGSYTLPYKTQLTGLIAVGRMTQNQNFQAYTVNPVIAASTLPTNSLDGEVWMTNAQIKLASRPMRKLRLNAELRYNERDNNTSTDDYDYVVLDSFVKSSKTGTTVQNRPYIYKNYRTKLDANYRFNAITSLRGGYKYNEMKRSYTNAERKNTTENTLFAKWKIKAHSTVDVALLGEASSRDGSKYKPLDLENPAMRKYNIADRDRIKMGTTVDYMATDKLFLSARVDYNKDDYRNTDIGLTKATQPVYTVDFSYQPRHNITTYGYYTYEVIKSKQAGEDVSPTSTADIWKADFKDTFDTIGVGAKWTDIGKWDIGADVVYSKSSGSIDMKDQNNPGAASQYPNTRTKLTSVKLWSGYNYSEQLSYKLGFWFEDYSADNWAIDGLQPYDPAAVENTLLLGNKTLDYNVYVITVSASYKY
jgi:MtrB/PioB family decaheme-associated outer membrane protein